MPDRHRTSSRRHACALLVLGLMTGVACSDDPSSPMGGDDAIASIEVTPATDSLVVGSTAQLTAVARDGDGNTIADASLTWTSSSDGVATVSASGQVTGQSAGTAVITASGGGETADASVTVFTGFTGAYQADNWSGTRMCGAACWTTPGITGGTTTIDPAEGASEPLTLSYDVDLGNPGSGVSQRTATFSAIATGTGTVSFDWAYTGFHAFFQANAELTVFAETGGGTTEIVEVDEAAGGNSFSFERVHFDRRRGGPAIRHHRWRQQLRFQ